MSDTAARQAMERMNLREVAIAPLYSTLGADLQQMSATDPEVAHKKFMEQRRDELCEAYGFNPVKQEKPFAFADGIAIIPFTGALINRFGGSYGGYVTGYNFIKRQLALALADDEVKGVVGDFNSYGGEAAGCFETSDMIFEARGQKPMIAVVDSNCYSAGYALASAFDKIVCTPSGGVGSIGVVAMHADMSKMIKDMGVEITFIHFGDHKVDGNPYEALSPAVKKDIQASVDKSGQMFVNLVARNRSISADKVIATQARCYRAEEALSLGLIDTIATPSQAVQVFFDELSGSLSTTQKEDAMSNAETKPGADDQANKDAAAAAHATAVANATKDAKTAERARVSGIQSCEEAKGRESLATHIAMNTDMSVDEAKAMMSASPKAGVQDTASKDGFKEAMDKSGHPNVGADSQGGNGGESKAKGASSILADFEAAGGSIEKTL